MVPFYPMAAAEEDPALRLLAALGPVIMAVLILTVSYAIIKGAVLEALKEHDRQRRKEEEKAAAERARQH